jgi:hypothetical protein
MLGLQPRPKLSALRAWKQTGAADAVATKYNTATEAGPEKVPRALAEPVAPLRSLMHGGRKASL